MRIRSPSSEFDGYSTDELVKAVVSGNQEPRGTDITQARSMAPTFGCPLMGVPESLRSFALTAYSPRHISSCTQ